MRILIVVFIAISSYIALNKDKVGYIANMMGISWGALAGAFLAPFLYGLYWKKTTRLSVWVSFIFGAGVMIIDMVYPACLPQIMQHPVNCGAIVMLAALVIVPVVSLITPKMKAEDVDRMFECYDKEVVVCAKESLGK